MSRPTRTPVAAAALRVQAAPFRLPAPVERAAAAAWKGRILVAGGLGAAGQSAAGVFALDPASGRLPSLGSLPLPFHDGAAALIGNRLYVFGGGTSASSDAVQALDPRTGRGTIVAHLPRPLSDLARTQLGGTTYLDGGFDGYRPRAEILATRDGHHFTLARRLPVGLRYPVVATAGGKMLVAGGQTATGLSAAVYVFDPATRHVQLLARLPTPRAHAAAIVSGHTLFLIGGTDAAGATTGSIFAVDLASHSVRRLALTISPLADAAAARVGGTTFLIGGRRSEPLSTVLEIHTNP